LRRRADPACAIRVVERNRPYDTFGWGVVFSDQTLGNLEAADPATAREIADAFNHWDDIEVHFKGRTITSGGHGFCGIGRKRLLNILQRRCEALGVELVFETDATGTRRRSSPTSTCGAAALCGSGRSAGSPRSRSHSSKQNGAGSRRTLINTMATRRPSSSKRRRTFGVAPALNR
jgi:hypothetical protein